MMAHNNCYTNLMVKKTFEFTLAALAEMKARGTGTVATAGKKNRARAGRVAQWRRMAANMRILYDPKTGLFEQHDGYFDMPHVDVKAIPVTDFPLYEHWAYFRLFRSDMIKQPDVLLFLFLYNQSFSRRIKQVNYEYYEPRCSHESSLSPAIHSILAAELGRAKEAYKFFHYATRA